MWTIPLGRPSEGLQALKSRNWPAWMKGWVTRRDTVILAFSNARLY
jgi:hypothetical protein